MESMEKENVNHVVIQTASIVQEITITAISAMANQYLMKEYVIVKKGILEMNWENAQQQEHSFSLL